MKKPSHSKITTIFIVSSMAVSLLLFVIGIFNLDLFLRLYHAYQNGKLTREDITYEIASYDIKTPLPVIPKSTKTSPIDGMTQIFISAGEFLMGNGKNPKTDNRQHQVFLDSYWIDKVVITNAMFARCLIAGACTHPATYDNYFEVWAYRDYPVVYVNWYQADQYCRWAGRSLPTEAQWEKAARGIDGRRYPWGNQLPNPRLANFNLSLIGEPVPVYRYPLGASPYGVLNMAGNVREWIADWYEENYYQSSPSENPKGPISGAEHSLRSGSNAEDQQQISVYTRFKHLPDSAGLNRGFRCAEIP